MSTSKSFLFLSLLCLILLSLPSSTFADFDRNDLDDHYDLKAGEASKCGTEFEVEDDDLTVEDDDIEIDDRGCRGGSLLLQRFPGPSTDNRAIRYFSDNDRIGDFLAGPASDTLTCGSKTVQRGTIAIFIKPERDVETTWDEIFGPGSELAEATSSQRVQLDDDTKYLILGDSCFYVENGDSICFPADATVTLPGGIHKRMDQVRTGDRVLVGDGTYSDVFAWTHRTSAKSARRYVRVVTETGHEFVSTPGHYVYADGEVMQAKKVRVGMKVQVVGVGDVSVVKVGRVKRTGLYNPQTVHGDIVVNGVLATTYTETIQPAVAHSLLAPVRAAWHVVGRWLVGETHSDL